MAIENNLITKKYIPDVLFLSFLLLTHGVVAFVAASGRHMLPCTLVFDHDITALFSYSLKKNKICRSDVIES